jgi:hypothetical protein
MGNETETTMKAFFGQFGEIDEYKLVVLQILFEEIYGRKALPLPGSTGQESHQDNQCVEGGSNPEEDNFSQTDGTITRIN